MNPRAKERPDAGWTLVAILIVLGIIVLVSGFILVGLSCPGPSRSRYYPEATTKVEVSSLSTALDEYLSDEGELRGRSEKMDPEDPNHFPHLFEALWGQPGPAGKGGRNAPYTHIDEQRVVIRDLDSEGYVPATPDQIRDPGVKKYLLDVFQNPFVYRASTGRRVEDSLRRDQGACIHSVGKNGIDDTRDHNQNSDDIGSW